MKIISWNTNGLRATIKQENFIPLFAFNNPACAGGPDIVCLQETKCEPEQLDEKSRNLKGYHSYFSYSKGRKGYSGVVIYSKTEPEKVEYGFGIPKFDDEGRTLVAYYPDFVLINCYFPNSGGGEERLNYKLEFYDAFLEFINKLKNGNNPLSHKATAGRSVIFCGDINTAHKEIDLARPKENADNTGFLPIERAWLDEVVNNGWVDIFRNFYPNKKDVYTYWDIKTRARDRNVGWRLDYFFTNQSFVSKIKSFKTMSDYYGSDHCPIMIEF
ncbi:MAG: exodeoxyribonuclease III [Candidatus Paceibacterota bacterium]